MYTRRRTATQREVERASFRRDSYSRKRCTHSWEFRVYWSKTDTVDFGGRDSSKERRSIHKWRSTMRTKGDFFKATLGARVDRCGFKSLVYSLETKVTRNTGVALFIKSEKWSDKLFLEKGCQRYFFQKTKSLSVHRDFSTVQHVSNKSLLNCSKVLAQGSFGKRPELRNAGRVGPRTLPRDHFPRVPFPELFPVGWWALRDFFRIEKAVLVCVCVCVCVSFHSVS